ncbi:MAG: phosphotransferase [Acidimicrobiia bacterium]
MRMQVSSDLRAAEKPSSGTEKIGGELSTSSAVNLPVPPNPGSENELDGWATYLQALNLLDDNPTQGMFLSVGDSGRVIAIDDVVIKRACRLLDTGSDWLANPYRTAAEGKALLRVATTYPKLVPKVLIIDEANAVLVLEKASGVTLKSQIFAGAFESSSIAATVSALEAVHSLPAERLDGVERFMTLRLSPYYLRTTTVKPEYADQIHQVVDRLRETQTHFVHGDFCPKNILIDAESPEQVTLLDWEVAHLGDPAFDYAFFLTHLIAKLHIKEELETEISAAITLLLGSYMRTLRGDVDWLTQLTGATILARCWGASRLEYLDQVTHGALSDLGAGLLLGTASLGEIL